MVWPLLTEELRGRAADGVLAGLATRVLASLGALEWAKVLEGVYCLIVAVEGSAGERGDCSSTRARGGERLNVAVL